VVGDLSAVVAELSCPFCLLRSLKNNVYCLPANIWMKSQQQISVVLSFCSDIERDENCSRVFNLLWYISMFFPIISDIFQLSLKAEIEVKQRQKIELSKRLLTVAMSFPS